jgi:6-phosphogluconolactonase
LNKFVFAVCVISLFIIAAVMFPGCGSSSHHDKLFIVASGTPSVGSFDIGNAGALILTTDAVSTGSNPQGILTDPKHQYVYVLLDAGPLAPGGIQSYSISNKGILAALQEPSTTTNISGNVPVNPTGVHPLSMTMDGGFIFVANAGSNNISAFSLDETTGLLTEVAGSPFPAGTAPVSVVARNSSVFVANRGDATVAAYSVDKSGVLTATGTPVTVGANTTSMDADAAGKLLFVADGIANTVSALSISSSGLTATSTPVTVGTGPSNVRVDPSGKYLYVANAGSGNLSAYTIDGSGGLSAISGSPFTVGTAPSFINTSSDGKLLFVANRGSANVSSFQVGSGGSLSAASGSPFAAAGFSNPVALLSLK